jgi:hypothetical protein
MWIVKLALNRPYTLDFTRATHAIWWVMTACGAAVLASAGVCVEHGLGTGKHVTGCAPARRTALICSAQGMGLDLCGS